MSVQMKLGSRRLLKAASICVLMVPPLASGELLFEENFDKQSDWHSGMEINDRGGWPRGEGPDQVQCVADGHILPEGWDCARQDPAWAPSVGHPDRHENIEILARNAGRARGGSGKSLVIWRDSTTGPEHRWNSDGMFSKVLDSGYNSLYVKFWIRLSPDWTPFGETGMTKLFRMSSYDGAGELYKAFGNGNNSAIFLWDYEANNYGVRNTLAFRGDPQETNYKIKYPAPIDIPRGFTGSMSLNFTGNVIDLDGDGQPDQKITDLINLKTGRPIDPAAQVVTHDELWGDEWHKVEFFIQMNSEPGAMDGVVKQWFDDQLVFSNESFPWMGYESKGGVLWNVVHFGGNSHFHSYPDSVRREEWYSIDDIVIRTDLPENRNNTSGNFRPKPPSSIAIE